MFAKKHRRVMAVILAVAMLVSFLPSVIPLTASAATTGKIRNEYIEAYFSDQGRFSFGTVAGDPAKTTDNGKRLLYGWSSSSTSYTLLSVNGSTAFFQADSSTFSADGLSCVSTDTIGNVLITQTVSIEYNAYTQRYDVFKIQYEMKNRGTSSANLGARVMIDTMLGDNDGAPFRIPGYGNITTRTEYSGSAIPQYFTVMDNLNNPEVVASGTLYTGANNEDKPDSVQFTNWGTVNSSNSTFHPSITTGSSIGDSAVAVYWNPDSIAAGGTRTFAFYYGIGNFEPVAVEGDLSAAVTAPAELLLTSNEQAYQMNPFTVETRIKNEKSATVSDVCVTISLPAGLSLHEGSLSRTMSIASGAEESVAFVVDVPVLPVEKTYAYSVKVESSALDEPAVFNKTIKAPAAKCLQVTYAANGGNDVLPLDTNFYRNGDRATVLFNTVPTRENYIFRGWARTANAATPEFTATGTKTFTIGNDDVTLYAVWELEHTTCVPSDWIIDRNPTCTETGSKHIECTDCGETLQTEMISAPGHNYVYTSTVEPTCTAEGYDLYTCDRNGCGSTKRQTIDKIPHDYGDDNVCDGCGHTIPVTHTHSYTSMVVPASCTSMGYTEYTCSCGHSYRDNYIENLPHEWTETITTPKTCTSDGLKTYDCDNCTASFTEIIPAGHNWQDTVTQPATCTADGQISRTCADCDAVETQVIPAGHTWNAGTQTKAPTCTEEGLLHHTCTVCGQEETAPIDPLGHTYVNGVCTRCGARFIDNITSNTAHPEYGMYFEVDDIKSGYGPDLINEYGVLLDYNPDAQLKKVAVYLTQDGTMWRRCIAAVGDNITYATYVPYLSYDEDIKYTGLNSAWINTFRLQKNNRGVWCYSDYATIGVNLEDAYGNLLLSLYDIGQAGAKTRIFDDLEEMKAWLEDDSDCITHTESDWIVDTEPTVDTEGQKHKECTSCGKVLETQSIPKLTAAVVTATSDPVILGQNFEVYIRAYNCDPVHSVAFIPTFDTDIFELVSVEWLVDADMQTPAPELISAAWSNLTDVNVELLKLVFKANALTGGSLISMDAMTQISGVVAPLTAIGDTVAVIECPHENFTVTDFDDTNHINTCVVCGYNVPAAHTFDHNCDTTCNGCAYTREIVHVEGALNHDETNHWHDCAVCGEDLNVTAHGYDNTCDTDCNICGAVREITHTPKSSWEHNETEHWLNCDVCGETLETESHEYDDHYDPICNVCGYCRVIRGDVDGDGHVTSADAILLLRHTYLSNIYHINQDGDMDGDGLVTSADAILLLRHTYLPNMYPLYYPEGY